MAQGTLYEMGKHGMIKVDMTTFTDLKRGQVIRWGGNMGYPECEKVIIEKVIGYEDRINYKVIQLQRYENEDDYEPAIRQTEASSIKDPNDKSLWHTQHDYMTKKIIVEEEIQKLELWAKNVKEKETKENDEAERIGNINIAKRNPELRPITVSLCYNNSNGMVDYYDPCRKIKTWVMDEIPEGRRLLSILKKIVAKYPKLSRLEWTDHKENHSMNSFGYSLTSESVKLADYTDEKAVVYLAGTVESGFFMVEFGFFEYDGKCDDWIEKPIQQKSLSPVFTGNIVFRENKEKNGLEIYFKSKPNQDVRDTLKSNGFRWGKYNKCWYKRNCEGLKEKIEKELKK